MTEVLPWRQAGFAALAAAGVDAWPIVKETAQGQLLPDRLSLILLGLQQEINKIMLLLLIFLTLLFHSGVGIWCTWSSSSSKKLQQGGGLLS